MVTLTSPGIQRRSFTHVEDIVDGLVLVGEVGEGDEFGLGTEESFSILEIAEMFGAKLDFTKAHGLGWWAQWWVLEYIQGVTEQSIGRPRGRQQASYTTFHEGTVVFDEVFLADHPIGLCCSFYGLRRRRDRGADTDL